MNKLRISKGWLATIIIVVVILIDQISKIWVKTHFFLGEDCTVFSWFHLVFVENNGMAFGWELGSKFFLTWFRIIAVCLLIYYLVKLRKSATVPLGYVACIALITAGALGNVLDCIFYGITFSGSTPMAVAQAFPEGGGYGTLFNGFVVDMFQFRLGNWPDWMPIVGGKGLFDFVFNFADACLSVSVVVLILFYAKYLTSDSTKTEVEAPESDSEEKEAENEA